MPTPTRIHWLLAAAAVTLLMMGVNLLLYGLSVSNFHNIDNVAYWLSYRYWIEGVDLAGDIDYVRPILSPGVLLYPFALAFDHPPHAVWAFNTVSRCSQAPLYGTTGASWGYRSGKPSGSSC